MAIEQELPPIRPDPCAIDVVRIPTPDEVEDGGVEGEGGEQGGGVVDAQVGAGPVDDAGAGG